MQFFEEVEIAPADPILGLSIAFQEDPRADKVNLGVGVYKAADLKPLVLASVKKAEERLLHEETSKEYLPIDGDKIFVDLSKKLLFGASNNACIYGAQSIGGTGALSIGAAFLRGWTSGRVFLPDPTWDNHPRIFSRARFEVKTYPYYDARNHGLDFRGMCAGIEQMEPKDVILLHSCCHNPTGFDPTIEQWKEICALVKKRSLFPFFDSAYLGFKENPEKDSSPIRLFIKEGIECFVALSYAKNFGLYAERAGALYAVCADKFSAKKVGSQLKVIMRGLYSNPPAHGARIVAMILGDPKLHALWQEELITMRGRIDEMRKTFLAALMANTKQEFGFMAQQKGMFSYTGLKQHQVEQLIADYGIYLPKDGRVNIAGLNTENLDYVVKAIAAVTQ